MSWLVLAGKTYTVVHPFAESIRRQYASGRCSSAARGSTGVRIVDAEGAADARGVSDRFGSWFDALAWLCAESDKIDFDVAIIGAGAYGFPLAAHMKRSGRNGHHLGGATQIMFGIMGRRWKKTRR
jgi:hypothetical protein